MNHDFQFLKLSVKTDLENELMVDKGRTLTEFGMVMHTLLYLKQVTKKDLLYKHMELCSMLCGSLDVSGVWRRMDTCICMAESL